MSGKPGIRSYVKNLAKDLSELTLAERWRLLLFLAARDPLGTAEGLSAIRSGRKTRQDIHIISWTIGDQARRVYSGR
jgi:hypothetical protein